jgi:hypothetical protein
MSLPSHPPCSLIILIIFSGGYRSWNFLSCSFLQAPLTSKQQTYSSVYCNVYMLLIIHACINYVAELDTGKWDSTGHWHLLIWVTMWQCTKQRSWVRYSLPSTHNTWDCPHFMEPVRISLFHCSRLCFHVMPLCYWALPSQQLCRITCNSRGNSCNPLYKVMEGGYVSIVTRL